MRDELALTRKMNEQEEDKLHLEEKYSSLAEEVASKTRKLKKVWAKYQQAKNEIKDLEHEFLDEKNDLIDSIRDLIKQMKLKDFIISNFIPPKVSLRCVSSQPTRDFSGMESYHLSPLQVCPSVRRCRKWRQGRMG